MTTTVFVRCLIVSFLAAAIVPALTMVTLAPSENEEVVDLRAIDPDTIAEDFRSPPTRRVQGFERFTYLFTHPQWLLFYWRAMVVWFVAFVAATTLVSYLNSRDQAKTRR